MQVKALISFVDSRHGSRAKGQVFALPEGVDWLRAGLVEAVEVAPVAETPKPARKRKNTDTVKES